MRKFIFASVSAIAMAGAAAHAQETLTYELNGEIDSNCVIIPSGTVQVDVDMENFSPQGLAAVTYSCNSPHTLTIESQRGGMWHVQSAGAVNIRYNVNTLGFGNTTGNGFQQFYSADIEGTPTVVATETSWANILVNGGLQFGNLDLEFPGLADSFVAGDYEDELTLTLIANL